MTTQKQLALQIRSRLALRDMTQRQLGEALGFGHAAVSARTNGHKDFTYTELIKTAEVLGVSLRDLLPADEKELQR
ncbi:helix-turn-helix domain-containing protein [Kocuria palustris]|uniref:helix-turn-helix domain-containing protein n=1 Tax=Kocuria palustris TaxID=71999 RepID=UPI002468A6F8|nr:helix-turn-helix transcriptional regulator [Kocuria palustris]MDH5152025.1 helix-turn-helix transcriptional regulator [Kocuria palustris]